MHLLTRMNISAENQQAIIKSRFIQENTTPQELLLHILTCKKNLFFPNINFGFTYLFAFENTFHVKFT